MIAILAAQAPVTTGNLVNDVVQALQGTLAGLVQSAIDARLSVLPTNSVENNLCQSSVTRSANLAGNAPVISHLMCICSYIP